MQTRTALIVIDMQQGLLDKAVFNKQTLLDNVNRVIDAFHDRGDDVFLIRHTNGGSSQLNSEAWQLSDQLHQAANDVVLNKSSSNVFKEKPFTALLEQRGIGRVVVVGLVSNGCVQAACLGAKAHGLAAILIGDAHSTWHQQAETMIADWNNRLSAEGIQVLTAGEFLEMGDLPA